MTFHFTTAALVAMVVTSAVAAHRWQQAMPAAKGAVRRMPPAPVNPRVDLDDSLAVAEEDVVANDPFRVSSSPSSVPFDALSENGGATGALMQPMGPRPTLTLKGVTGGPPWQAIIDGIPGQPSGTIASEGARFDRLVVRSISRDSVVVQGTDTSWTLTFRRP